MLIDPSYTPSSSQTSDSFVAMQYSAPSTDGISIMLCGLQKRSVGRKMSLQSFLMVLVSHSLGLCEMDGVQRPERA